VRRSGCPLNASVEILGDRWSLLIIRDMMLRGFRTYKEFMGSYEGIATNILADRLRKLIAHGIITTRKKPIGRTEGDLLAHPEGNSIWRRSLWKWCYGLPCTKIPAIRRLSEKCERTRKNS